MGHWYAQDGTPCYEVPKTKGGGTRPTTLADARKLNLVPSVTTILALLAKPALEKWKTDQLLNAVLENPLSWNEEEELWKKRVYAISEKVGKEAAEIGTKIHDALENCYLKKPITPDMSDYCTPVLELLKSTFGQIEWIPEAYFAHKDGFGGKCDLHFKGNEQFPDGIILDFKTKSTENFSKVKAYNEHCMQLVAYREGFGLPKAKCYNLFISVNEPGKLFLHCWDEKDCENACKMFYCLLYYWKHSNKIKEQRS